MEFAYVKVSAAGKSLGQKCLCEFKSHLSYKKNGEPLPPPKGRCLLVIIINIDMKIGKYNIEKEDVWQYG